MKKVRKVREKTQTVRVEVVAPQAATTEALATTQPAPILGDNVEQALERAQRQMYFRNQLLKLIAKQINPRDIYVYVIGVQCKTCNGVAKPSTKDSGYYCRRCGPRKLNEVEEQLEPYLSGAGCRFVLSSAGAKFSDPEIIEKRYEGVEGPYIDFEVWVTVETSDGRVVRTMGNNATDDDFFAKRWRYVCPNCEEPTVLGYGESCARHGKVKAKREPYYLSMQEVDIPAVKQKAMTNAWNHAVRDLGFMPNIEHLKAADVDISRLRRIEFGKRDEESSNEFPAAASKERPPEKATAEGRGQPSAAGTKPPPKTTNASVQQAAPATQAEKPTEVSKPEKESPTQLPMARIPYFVESVKWTQSGKGLGVKLKGGPTVYAFDNRKMGEDGDRMLDLLVKAIDQECVFACEKRKTNDNREYINVVAVLRIGDREWEEDGMPVIRREREPGEDE